MNDVDPIASENTVIIRRTDQKEIPIRVVDAFAINRALCVNQPVRTLDHPTTNVTVANGDDEEPVCSDEYPVTFVCLEFAEGDLTDLTSLIIRGNVSGCECEVHGRRFTLEGTGSVHIVELDAPRIPGTPVMARYMVVRRNDKTKRSVSLSGVHIRSTDYAEPWPVAAHMRPLSKPGAIRRLLDYSDYTACETDPHPNAAIELDYGEDVPIFSVTLITNVLIAGCAIELLRGEDRSIVFCQNIDHPAVVQVIHTST